MREGEALAVQGTTGAAGTASRGAECITAMTFRFNMKSRRVPPPGKKQQVRKSNRSMGRCIAEARTFVKKFDGFRAPGRQCAPENRLCQPVAQQSGGIESRDDSARSGIRQDRGFGQNGATAAGTRGSGRGVLIAGPFGQVPDTLLAHGAVPRQGDRRSGAFGQDPLQPAAVGFHRSTLTGWCRWIAGRRWMTSGVSGVAGGVRYG